ncbi:MAG: MFS transporter [Cytophagales bacterium]|nr:MFS transporter [Cytophagales bacterium]
MRSIKQQRIFLSVFFFLSGISFSSWTSRIPTIKAALGLNEAELGSILLAMPISSVIGLPLSGWLVSRFDSRVPLVAGFVVNACCLPLIGLAHNPYTLVVALFLYAMSMRIINIAMNTQALHLQKKFDRKINGSFHGLWSTGGIVGVGFTTLLISGGVSIVAHLLAVAGVLLLATAYSYRFLLRGDRAPAGNKLAFGRPDPYILYLGLLVFLAAICEGGMFDWSGIYFQQVIRVELFTYGYLVFMVFMALSRFLSDRIIERIGMAATYVISALCIGFGISLSILFAQFWPALFGFALVGFGTASVIPMTYTLAGASPRYSPGVAISLIATFGIAGVLAGPPLIGYLAHAFSLKVSFVAFALAGLLLIPVSRLFFKLK